jgi:hypothetical protein
LTNHNFPSCTCCRVSLMSRVISGFGKQKTPHTRQGFAEVLM